MNTPGIPGDTDSDSRHGPGLSPALDDTLLFIFPVRFFAYASPLTSLVVPPESAPVAKLIGTNDRYRIHNNR